jgi:triosephosphate isomerase
VKPFVAGNWKMNPEAGNFVELASQISDEISDIDGVNKVLCPPTVALRDVATALEGSDVFVGAQDGHPEASGAFTGEVAMGMLSSMCSYVIVGHSERRALFGETDQYVARKAVAAIANGLSPIVCIGESLDVRDAGDALTYVHDQLVGSLAGVDDPAMLVIGYEPVWAIGTGVSARPDVAGEMAESIRNTLIGLYSEEAVLEVPILYGGSVSLENIGPYIDRPHINGALVGVASLKPGDFGRIVSLVASIRG